MPLRAPYICGCGKVVPSSERCACRKLRDDIRKAYHDVRRPSAGERGYGSKWRKAREEFLARPENRHCACGCGRIADMVDHIIPHRGDMKLFWSRSNWQAMASSPCHSSQKQSLERRKREAGA